MKRATAWGGFAGFMLAGAAGLLAGRDPVLLLLDGCLACLVGAWLVQWLHRLAARSLREALAAREEADAGGGEATAADKARTAGT